MTVGRHFSGRKRFTLTSQVLRGMIALLLILAALLNITYAWLMKGQESDLGTNGFLSVTADGLIMKDLDGNVHDELPLFSKLSECTSTDGRNIYFPLTSDYTTFRRADANDRNTKYIELEFTLTSDDRTDVWVSNESYIFGAAADAIRLSIDCLEDDSDPHVFDASEEYVFPGDNEHEINGGVIDDAIICDGVTLHGMPDVKPLSRSFFSTGKDGASGDEQVKLMTIEPGAIKTIVVKVWLEGRDSDCNNRVYNSGEIQIHFKFSTGIDDPKTLKFSDFTFEPWVYLTKQKNSDLFRKFFVDSNDIETAYNEFIAGCESVALRRVFLRDKITNTMYAMYRSVGTEASVGGQSVFYQWTVTVPASVTNVEFVRLNHLNGSPEEREYWNAGSTYSDTSKLWYTRYYALTSGTESINDGRWSNKTNVLTLYFLDNKADMSSSTFKHSLNFGYYGQHDFTQKMTYIGKVQGVDFYAMRAFDGARNNLEIRRADGVIYYPSARSSGNNLCSWKNGNLGWSLDSGYPRN